MSNHQYSSDKATVIRDDRSEAEGVIKDESSGRMGAKLEDITEGDWLEFHQQSQTSLPIIPLFAPHVDLYTPILPCLEFSTPTCTFLVVPLPHSPPLTGGKGWCPGLVHHKDITRTWTKYQAKTHLVHLKSIQNAPNQFPCSVPGSGNGQHIHSVPDHVTRVPPSGTPWEHSKFPQRKYPEFS